MSFLYGNPFAMPQAPLYSQPALPSQLTQLTQLAQLAQLPSHLPPQRQPPQLSTPSYQQSNDAFYQDILRQLAAAAAAAASSSAATAPSAAASLRRRHSRSSQPAAMRVVKPSSASNSPTSSIVRKRMPPAAAMPSRPARPVSWHPSSTRSNFLMPPQYFNNTNTNNNNTPLQPDDLLYAYSNQTSPSTAFSPYLAAAPSYEMRAPPNHYGSPNPWALSPSTLPVAAGACLFDKLPSPDCPPLDDDFDLELELDADDREAVYRQQQEQCRQQVAAMHARSSTASAASSEYAYAIRAPRTPPMCTLHRDSAPAPVAVAEAEAAPDAADDDADGEILVGMGLYDPPEKGVDDGDDDAATLQRYRSSVAQLLGAAYPLAPATGKGLKLEDAWEPPADMDDDDDERDAEGEDSP